MARLMHVVGARPNFMKIAPIMEAARGVDGVEQILVHTGQHYDANMSQVFFDDLGLPRPERDLGVGSDEPVRQIARVIVGMQDALADWPADVVVVVGDVNSTLAAAVAANKSGVRVAHVEAGLRSRDRSMPEEINRIATDQIAEHLFVSEPSGQENLRREGVRDDRIFLVGNCMIDTLRRFEERARELNQAGRMGLDPDGYALLTLHRPSNVDDRDTFDGLLGALAEIASRLPIVFPVHPRTTARIEQFGWSERLAGCPGLKQCAPLGYLEFLSLVTGARMVMTDSGGLQEETTALGVPCLTLRENTERPITITEGTNTLVGTDPGRLLALATDVLEGRYKTGRCPDLWDGHAGQRIVEHLVRYA